MGVDIYMYEVIRYDESMLTGGILLDRTVDRHVFFDIDEISSSLDYTCRNGLLDFVSLGKSKLLHERLDNSLIYSGHVTDIDIGYIYGSDDDYSIIVNLKDGLDYYSYNFYESFFIDIGRYDGVYIEGKHGLHECELYRVPCNYVYVRHILDIDACYIGMRSAIDYGESNYYFGIDCRDYLLRMGYSIDFVNGYSWDNKFIWISR